MNCVIDNPEYDFLRTDPHLGKNILFLVYGGSYAYGTNVEGSDIDIRGCAANSKAELLGLSGFEQVVDTATDTTVYAFNKLMGLLADCNPNTIEMLGCKPEHYLLMTPIGRELVADHDLLMSIRQGAYQREDHSYAPEFFELVTQCKKRLDYAKNNTGLPEHPDMKRVEEFMIHVNESVVRGEI